MEWLLIHNFSCTKRTPRTVLRMRIPLYSLYSCTDLINYLDPRASLQSFPLPNQALGRLSYYQPFTRSSSHTLWSWSQYIPRRWLHTWSLEVAESKSKPISWGHKGVAPLADKGQSRNGHMAFRKSKDGREGREGIQFISSRFRCLLVVIKLVVIYTKANQSSLILAEHNCFTPTTCPWGYKNHQTPEVLIFLQEQWRVPENCLTLKHLYQRHTHINLWK